MVSRSRDQMTTASRAIFSSTYFLTPEWLSVFDRFQAGVSKLTDAKTLVDNLKEKAAEQSTKLAEKQEEADAALREITISMQVKIFSHPVVAFINTHFLPGPVLMLNHLSLWPL